MKKKRIPTDLQKKGNMNRKMPGHVLKQSTAWRIWRTDYAAFSTLTGTIPHPAGRFISGATKPGFDAVWDFFPYQGGRRAVNRSFI